MQTRMQLGRTVAAIVKRFMQLAALALTLAWTTTAFAQQAYYIYPDHLNTPRAIENQAMQLVWRWENRDPFGANLPDENPSSLGNFTCNLRLPGQYFDVEAAYHYNYFRDYAPETGRYIQSDPIGLKGGLNTYIYVTGNPIELTDPYGLETKLYGTGANLMQYLRGIVVGTKLGQKCRDYFCKMRIKPNIENILAWCVENGGGDSIECNTACTDRTLRNPKYQQECVQINGCI